MGKEITVSFCTGIHILSRNASLRRRSFVLRIAHWTLARVTFGTEDVRQKKCSRNLRQKDC